MKRFLSIMQTLLLVLLAIAAGLGSAWWSIKYAPTSVESKFQVGVWQGNTLTGSRDADDLTRARVALTGLLALDRSETIYFVAHTDSQLRPLRSRCTYKVSGTAPAARWWSITPYAEDHFLFDAKNQQFSFTANGEFSFSTGPRASAGMTWLPTPSDHGLELVLRLYQPDAALQTAPASLRAPVVEQIGGCA